MRILAVVVLVLIASSGVTRADQAVSSEQVVHSRPAPVIVRKVVPPFCGVHVYQGRISRR